MSGPERVDEWSVLMLGKGWYPDEVGGLDRYFRGLLEHSSSTRGVVEGPVSTPDPRVLAGGARDQFVVRRLFAFTRAVRRSIRGADVVDAHFALTAFLPFLALRPRQRRVVHFHGPWADESAYEDGHAGLSVAIKRRVERSVLGRADLVVTLTHAFKREVVERYGVSPWIVHVLAPAVDTSAFSAGDRGRARGRLGIAGAGFVAVCVRRLVPRTGVDDLLTAWVEAVADLGEHARLVVAGDGPLLEGLQDRVRSEPGLASVTVLGRIDHDTLLDVYRAADVNVVPSRALEGFGLTVMEAGACGTPSIVTRVGGLPEAVRDQGPGQVVAAASPSVLAARLVAAAAGDLPPREHVSSVSAARTWRDVADDHARLYASRLGGAGGSPGRRGRVVFLSHTAVLSGAELALLRMVAAPEASVDVHVILGADGPLAARLTELGVSVEVVPIDSRAQSMRKDEAGLGAGSLGAAASLATHALRLARRLRAIRPDVVHCNSLKSGLYGTLAARMAGTPAVWHVHDRISDDYLPSPVVPVLRLAIRRLPTTIAANSRTVADTIGAGARTVHVIPNPVAVRTLPAPPRDAVVVGMLGRLAEWKGQHVFLDAFAEAFRGGPVRARIVGSPLFGEEPYAERLLAQVAALGIVSQVEFVGFADDVGAELAQLDVLVHCSIVPEPFGQVVVEGMAAGLPVIASDAGGPTEIVDPGVNGLLTRPGDATALAAAMRRLAEDPALRGRLGRAAVDAAGAYSTAAAWRALTAMYDDTVRKPS